VVVVLVMMSRVLLLMMMIILVVVMMTPGSYHDNDNACPVVAPRYEPALALLEEALNLQLRSAGLLRDPAVACSLSGLAAALVGQGEWGAALDYAMTSLDVCRAALPANHPAMIPPLALASRALMEQGRLREAEVLARRAVEGRGRESAEACVALANVLIACRRPEALEWAEKGLAILQSAMGRGRAKKMQQVGALGRGEVFVLWRGGSLVIVIIIIILLIIADGSGGVMVAVGRGSDRDRLGYRHRLRRRGGVYHSQLTWLE
jgi:tetratricopeptide (TPR) repeat protein